MRSNYKNHDSSRQSVVASYGGVSIFSLATAVKGKCALIFAGGKLIKLEVTHSVEALDTGGKKPKQICKHVQFSLHCGAIYLIGLYMKEKQSKLIVLVLTELG